MNSTQFPSGSSNHGDRHPGTAFPRGPHDRRAGCFAVGHCGVDIVHRDRDIPQARAPSDSPRLDPQGTTVVGVTSFSTLSLQSRRSIRAIPIASSARVASNSRPTTSR